MDADQEWGLIIYRFFFMNGSLAIEIQNSNRSQRRIFQLFILKSSTKDLKAKASSTRTSFVDFVTLCKNYFAGIRVFEGE